MENAWACVEIANMKDYKKIILFTICFSFLIFKLANALPPSPSECLDISYLLKECEKVVLGSIKEIKVHEEREDYRPEKQERSSYGNPARYYPHNEIRTIYRCEAVVAVEKYITGIGPDMLTFWSNHHVKPDACFTGLWWDAEIKKGERGYFFFNCKKCRTTSGVIIIKEKEKDWEETDKAIQNYQQKSQGRF